MKLSDLSYPDCRHCGCRSLSQYTSITDAEGNVTDVMCPNCHGDRKLAQWSTDHRLHSGLTIEAACKSWAVRVAISPLPGYDSARALKGYHAQKMRVAFEDADNDGVEVVFYTPRDVIFPAPIMAQMSSASMREFRRMREFTMFDGTVAVAHGRVCSWDMRWLDVSEAFARVTRKAKDTVETRVWFGGLQKIVRASKARKMASEEIQTRLGAMKCTTFCSAARCLIQIEMAAPGGASITLITAEDEAEPRMGVAELDATEAEAIAIVEAFTTAWGEGDVIITDVTDASGS